MHAVDCQVQQQHMYNHSQVRIFEESSPLSTWRLLVGVGLADTPAIPASTLAGGVAGVAAAGGATLTGGGRACGCAACCREPPKLMLSLPPAYRGFWCITAGGAPPWLLLLP